MKRWKYASYTTIYNVYRVEWSLRNCTCLGLSFFLRTNGVNSDKLFSPLLLNPLCFWNRLWNRCSWLALIENLLTTFLTCSTFLPYLLDSKGLCSFTIQRKMSKCFLRIKSKFDHNKFSDCIISENIYIGKYKVENAGISVFVCFYVRVCVLVCVVCACTRMYVHNSTS